MDAITILIAMLVGYVLAIVTLVMTRREIADQREAHARELEIRDIRIEQLIDQVQLNAQHMPYYPQLGPAPEPEPDARYLSSDDGLIVFEDFVDQAMAEVVGD
jgi:hypothetical protein